MNKVLEIKHLTKSYKEKKVVNNLSFNIYEGEIFGFIGPNGAGKSTTIKMITGLCSIDSGDVLIAGHSITKEHNEALKNVGAIIESPDMYEYMTGYKNLLYFAKLHGGISKDRILEVAEKVGLTNKIHDKVKKYSMGMKQRLGIAQAILHKPKLLILDEPTNGLDAAGIIEIRNLLKEYAEKEKISILISSHILSELEHICDTVAIIKKGSIIELKSLNHLKQGSDNAGKVAFKVDYPNYAGKLVYLKYNIDVDLAGEEIVYSISEKMINEIISYLISKGVSIFGVRKIEKSLEEIFIDIINKK